MKITLVPVEEYKSVGWISTTPDCPFWSDNEPGQSCESDGSGCIYFGGINEQTINQLYAYCGHPDAGRYSALLRAGARFRILDDLARAYRDDQRVMGFRVFGPVKDYEVQWNSESRSPLRWRSGEWTLVAGHDGFEPIFRKAAHMREPVAKFYKNRQPGGNGAFAITTTAANADEFLREAAETLPSVLEHLRGDLEFTLDGLLPQLCEVWAKLRGYKADTVFERRQLIVGEPTPEAHMDYLNNAEPFTDAQLQADA